MSQITLTRREWDILGRLYDGRELYGLDLVKAGIGSRGTIYVSLSRMEDNGWLTAREVEYGDLKRLCYCITEKGRDAWRYGQVVPSISPLVWAYATVLGLGLGFFGYCLWRYYYGS